MQGRVCGRTRGSDDRGQAMVEFTLMIMLLLVVVFGIIDFGAALYDQTMLASAAADGARSGAISNSTSTAQSAALAAVNNAIGCTPTASATTVASTPAQIQVTATCRYSGITPLGALVGIVIPTITAQASAKIE